MVFNISCSWTSKAQFLRKKGGDMPFMLVLAYFILQRGRDADALRKAHVLAEWQALGLPPSLPGSEDWLKGRAAAGPRGPAQGGCVFRKSRQCPLPLRPGRSFTQCACARWTRRKGEGGGAAATQSLHSVMLAEGRAQQGCTGWCWPRAGLSRAAASRHFSEGRKYRNIARDMQTS